MSNSIYIVQAKRTAVGSLLGSLKDISASMLGAKVIKSLISESSIDPNYIDEVVMGQVLTGGSGQNPARAASVYAGIPKEVCSYTINKVCGSSLKAVCLASNSILAGESELVIAGGQENMSLALHAAYIRAGNKLGNFTMLDLMQYDGLTDVFSGKAMGVTAENIASRFNISRKEQDEFSYRSHKKAMLAQTSGVFDDEIAPVEVVSKKESLSFNADESIRHEANIESLNKLRAVFVDQGSVTAGNSSPINDGAAALLIASEAAVKRYDLNPMARIASYCSAGVEPDIMGTAPVPASRKAISKAGWDVQSLDLVECNEAFAAQAIYVNRQMEWDVEKVNLNGGAIAIGHPIGASGARILTSLVHSMKKRNSKRGLATMCIGGGMGIAICVENVF